MIARTLYDKLWELHTVHVEEDGTTLLYIDRHLVHEVTSPQAFEGLLRGGLSTRVPIEAEDHPALGFYGINDALCLGV